jgi:UDP-N-acetylglucosamine 4,6-dehydratase/5-epimerase
MFDNAKILVTGGTGSFGMKFVKYMLMNHSPERIVVFSRDEMKLWEMENHFGQQEKRIRYFVGDVRDKDRLYRACNGIDFIVHAAALKIVPFAEYNPFEYIKTNIIGAMNVIDVAIERKVKRVVAISTDKACNPINLYGATKLCSDKLFIASNSYSGAQDTRFSVVRYGNVMGSRGSIIPFFLSLAKNGKEIPVTDEHMTRFMISLEQGVQLVCIALSNCIGGEIYIKKIPSMKVIDIARVVAPNAKIKIVGIRPGEKMHEQMITKEDASYTYEYEEYYKILPAIYNWNIDGARIGNGTLCKDGFCYSSDTNPQWMTTEMFRAWMKSEYGEEN